MQRMQSAATALRDAAVEYRHGPPVPVAANRQRLVGLDPMGVAHVVGIVSFLTAGTTWFLGVLLWGLGMGSGLIGRLEQVIAPFTQSGEYQLGGPVALVIWTVLTVGWAAVATALSALVTVIVNAVLERSGGLAIRLTAVEEPTRGAAARKSAVARLSVAERSNGTKSNGNGTNGNGTNGNGTHSNGNGTNGNGHRRPTKKITS